MQPGLTGMDLMDSVDILTSIYGGWIDMVPSYIGGRLYGLPSDNSYTEEVAGSSPVPPTLLPPGMGVLFKWGLYMRVYPLPIKSGVIIWCNRVQIGCSWVQFYGCDQSVNHLCKFYLYARNQMPLDIQRY